VAGRIWVIGGRSGSADFGEVDIYDQRNDQWTAGPAIDPRGTHGAVFYRGAIWVFGGESQARNASLDSVLRLDPAIGTWQAAGGMPTARNYARAVILNDAVYVAGGSPVAGYSHSSTGSAVVERFSARSPSGAVARCP
jgi:N-acetylneuraminic acid mutarotase